MKPTLKLNKPLSHLLAIILVLFSVQLAAAPYITKIKTPSCVTPGKSSIGITGRNFGTAFKKKVVVYSGRTLIGMEVTRWSNRLITAFVPQNNLFKPGKVFYLRIQYKTNTGQMRNSNGRRAFSICPQLIINSTNRRTTIPLRTRKGSSGKTPSPTGDSGETDSTEYTDIDTQNTDPNNPDAIINSTGSGINSATVRQRTAPPPTTQKVKRQQKYIPRQVMLTSKNMQQANKLYSVVLQQGYKVISRRHYKGLGLVLTILRTPDGVSADQAITSLRAQYKQSAIDRNTVYTLHAGKPESLKYMQRINWSTPTATCGKGLKVGLLDSAVDTKHKAFRSRNIIQKTFIVAGTSPASRLHGTAIASQWLGNSKSGIAGVIPGATLYSGAVFYKKNKQQLTNSNLVISGLDWLIVNRVDVINLSFGGQRNDVIEKSIKKALSKGISVVASAGNGGPKGKAVYPAAQKGVVAVTALTVSNKIYAYATHGHYIDLAAPGVNILVAKPGNRIKYVSGTSFSAPYVSAALLVLKRKKNLRSHHSRLRWLKQKARSLGTAKTFGKGLLQVPGACRG
ncbi:hypothetical protein MNBD_GAMMA12-58 [hydrothermal vent metagenome]|uniref:Peptidase S8/S53 domain-containing protein n=1 Tax=hydrothermal vent metagenome TaxID=652676 RepID=A0A3B0Z020_9ZZZZ